MTYKCEVCHIVSKPKQSRLTYYILRPDRQIARELTVCFDHKTALDGGVPLVDLMQQNAERRRLTHIQPPSPSIAPHHRSRPETGGRRSRQQPGQ